MPSDAAVYESVVEGFTARLAGVSTDQWDAATPCQGWDVRELVAHTVSTHRKVLAALGGDGAIAVDADGDLLEQWAQATGSLGAAMHDPERSAQTVRGVEGSLPFSELVAGLISPDTLAHTWDLARATGQEEQLDAACVEACTAQLPRFGETLLRLGGFAEVTPDVDASAQTRYLNAVGRSV